MQSGCTVAIIRSSYLRYSHMQGTDPKTNAVDTHAGAPVPSDRIPAIAPPATPPTSNRMDSTPAACSAPQEYCSEALDGSRGSITMLCETSTDIGKRTEEDSGRWCWTDDTIK